MLKKYKRICEYAKLSPVDHTHCHLFKMDTFYAKFRVISPQSKVGRAPDSKNRGCGLTPGLVKLTITFGKDFKLRFPCDGAIHKAC